jgi:hypothetical protein
MLNEITDKERFDIGERSREKILNEHTAEKRAGELISYFHETVKKGKNIYA